MLADPRSEALSKRFARQWLRLGDVEGVLPDAVAYPYFDRTLGDAFVKESELFFDSLVREDRSVLDLLTADYSFVNERIARHYGIPNVTGNAFRRVPAAARAPRHPDAGQRAGAHLGCRSHLAGDARQVGDGSDDGLAAAAAAAQRAGVRGDQGRGRRQGADRARAHGDRTAPIRPCMSCHRVIDPIGLSLENFDVTGKWRIKDAGAPVDTAGTLYDGTPIVGAAGPAHGAAEAPGRVPPELHGEPDDLRARPPRRSRRTCGRCAASSATRTRRT